MTLPDPPVGATERDHAFMAVALAEAETAATLGDVPVGAILVAADGTIVARAHNRREQLGDPTAHAEVEALRQPQAGGWRRAGTTMYVTLEPCTMCMGALILARVERVVFGAFDPKGGAAVTLYSLGSDPRLNHRVEVLGGVEEAACAAQLKRFFAGRRRGGHVGIS